MKTEYEKMLAGEVYRADDADLIEMLNAVKDLCWEYNRIRPTDLQARSAMLQRILG